MEMPTIKVNNINMYYEIHGDGEPLVSTSCIYILMFILFNQNRAIRIQNDYNNVVIIKGI